MATAAPKSARSGGVDTPAAVSHAHSDDASADGIGLVTQPQLWAMHTHQPQPQSSSSSSAPRRRRLRPRRSGAGRPRSPARRNEARRATHDARGEARQRTSPRELPGADGSEREATLRQSAEVARQRAVSQAQLAAVSHAAVMAAGGTREGRDARNNEHGARHAKSFASRMWSSGLTEEGLVAQPGSMFVDPGSR